MIKESAIEKKVCDYAKSLGWICEKFRPITNGYPDRIFLKNGKVFFIEFKAKGKLPAKIQQYRIEALRLSGFNAYVVDDVAEGRLIIEKEND